MQRKAEEIYDLPLSKTRKIELAFDMNQFAIHIKNKKYNLNLF